MVDDKSNDNRMNKFEDINKRIRGMVHNVATIAIVCCYMWTSHRLCSESLLL